MREMKKRLLAGASALAIIMTSGVPAAFAEGSRELVDMTGKTELASNEIRDGALIGDDKAYRTYLEWRDRPQLGDVSVDPITGAESTTNQIQSKSVFYVYAKAGETVYFGQSGRFATDRSITAVAAEGMPTDAQISSFASSYQPLRGSTIAVTMPVDDKTAFDPTHLGTGAVYAEGSEINDVHVPDTRIYLFKPQDKKGVITNTVQEQIGPKYGSDAERNLKGYDPFSFVAPVTGTYSFRFIGQNYVTSDHETIARPTATPAPTRTPERTPAPTAAPTPDPETVLNPLPAGEYPVDKSKTTAFGTADSKVTGSELLGSDHYFKIEAGGNNVDVQPTNNKRIILPIKADSNLVPRIELIPSDTGTIIVKGETTDEKNKDFIITQGSNKSDVLHVSSSNTSGTTSLHVTAGTPVYIYEPSGNANAIVKEIDLILDDTLYTLKNGEGVFMKSGEGKTSAGDTLADIAHHVSTNGTVTSADAKTVFGSSTAAAAALSGSQYIKTIPSSNGYVEVVYTGEGTINGAVYTSGTDVKTALIPAAANTELQITASGAVNVYGVRQRAAIDTNTYVFGNMEKTNGSVINGEGELYTYFTAHAGGAAIEAGELDVHKKNVFGSESGAFIKLPANGTETAGSIELIPSAGGTLTVCFAQANAAGDLTLKQGETTASKTADASALANTPGKVTEVSIGVEANKPVYIYSAQPSYIYGVKLSSGAASLLSYGARNTFAAMGTASLSETVTDVYDFEDSTTNPFTKAEGDNNPMTIANVYNEEIGSKVLEFSQKSKYSGASAVYEFTNAEDDIMTVIDFDCFIQGDTLSAMVSVGNNNTRSGKYYGSNSQWYSNTGTAFAFGASRKDGNNCLYLGKGYVTPLKSFSESPYSKQWLHVNVTFDRTKNTYSYQINKLSDNTELSKADNIQTDVGDIDEIDIFGGYSNNTKLISVLLDNLSVKKLKNYNATFSTADFISGWSADGVQVSSEGTFLEGTTHTVTAATTEGHRFGGIIVTDASGNDIDVTDNQDGTYSFTMPASDVTITPKYRVTVNAKATIDGTPTVIKEYFADVADTAATTTVYYNKYIEYNGEYYVTTQQSPEPYCGKELSYSNNTADALYTRSDITYFAEFEDLNPSNGWVNGDIYRRYSMGEARRLLSNSYVEITDWTPAGGKATVDLEMWARNSSSNSYNISVYLKDISGTLTKAANFDNWTNAECAAKIVQDISVPVGSKLVIYNDQGSNSNLQIDYVAVKAKYEYHITANQTTGGTVTASPGTETTFSGGETVTLSNTPVEGYEFKGYLAANTDTNEMIDVGADGTFTMPAADVSVSAVFAQPNGGNVITKSVSGSGGLTLKSGDAEITDGQTAAKDTTITVVPVPGSSSHLAALYYTYEDLQGDVHFAQLVPENGFCTFTMPDSPVKVAAVYGDNIITIADTTGGYISLNDNCYGWNADGNRYAATGAAVSGAYIPETYFNLENLVVNIYDGTTGAAVPHTDNGNGTFSFTMPENSVIITATFADSRVALAELPVNEAASPGAISTSVNGVDSGAALTTGVIDKTNQYLGLYGSASASGSSVTISSSIDSMNGVLEVIPAASGVINITYSGNNGTLFAAQTDVFTAESIKNNTIAVTTDTAGTLKAVVESHAPVYIYTANGSAGVDSVAINTSTNLAGDEWSLETTSSLVGAWDITVVSNDNGTLTEHKGRVWTDIMFLNARAYKQSIYSSPYILTDDGYEYRFSFNGMQPFSAIFFSNSRGFLADRVGEDGARNVQPLYHSYYSHGRDGVGVAPSRDEVTGFKTVTYSNFTPHEAGIDKTHRLFLNELNENSTAVGVYSTGWATGATHGIFDQIEPTYEGYGGNAKNDGAIHKGTIGSGGKFEFTVTKGVTTSWDAATATLTVSPEDLQAINGKIFCLALNYSEYALDANRAPITHKEEYTFKDEFEDDGVTPKTKLVDVWTKVSALGEAAHNPDAEEGNIVVLAAAIYLDDNTPSKTFSMVWDGKDVYGNDVPVTIEHYDAEGVLTNDGSYYTSNTAESQGEVHMPMADVEAFPHGVKIERINSLDGASTENKGEVAYSKYRLYYNNQAEAPGYSKDAETGKVVYDYTGKTSWYFVGRTQQPYVTKIGDGLNGTAGVNTQNEGGMKVGNYPFIKNTQSTYDNTNADPTAEPGWYKDQSNVELYSAYDAAYGNEAALDMWTRFVASLSKTLKYGVNPRNNKDKPAPIVSFVAEDGKTELTGDFSQSHVKLKSGDTYFYPGNHGRPMYWQVADKINGTLSDPLESFGNTISTGFVSNFNVEEGVTYNAVMWDITVPIGENTLVKLPDEGDDNDNGFTSGWTSLKGNKKGNLTDTDSITMKAGGQSVDYDEVINKGSIYETAHANADEFVIRAKHEIPPITGDKSGTTQVVVGLIIDNIYAPDAKAIAAYVDVTDKEEKVDENTTKIVYSAYHDDSAHTELVYDPDQLDGAITTGTESSPIDRLGAIHVILNNETNGEGAFGLFKSNRFNYYTGENRTPDKATTSAEDEEAWFLSRDKAVSFWESLEENESFGDISDEANAEANGSGDGISMDDLSNGIETIDDILGQN